MCKMIAIATAFLKTIAIATAFLKTIAIATAILEDGCNCNSAILTNYKKANIIIKEYENATMRITLTVH